MIGSSHATAKIKVILKKTGEIKEVAFGYAVNFLIPKGLAVKATEEEIRRLEIKRLREKNKREQELRKQEDLLRKFSGKEFNIKAKAGKKGKLFGAVTKKDLAGKLGVERKAIVLEKPIKKVGEHEVELKLASKRVKVKLKVIA